MSFAVKPRAVPLTADAAEVAEAAAMLRTRCGDRSRHPYLVGLVDAVVEVLAVESDAERVDRQIRRVLAYLAADRQLSTEELAGQEVHGDEA